jgi:putative ABC transport system substrate-binding protein
MTSSAFNVLAHQHIDVLVMLQTVVLPAERRRIAALTAAARLPAIYGYREHVDDGGLISYRVGLGGYYVQRILSDVAPSESVPAEFPTKLGLIAYHEGAKCRRCWLPRGLLLTRPQALAVAAQLDWLNDRVAAFAP